MLIFFNDRELPRCMEGFDLGHWNGYVAKNIAMKGHCAGHNTNQLAGELVSVDEDNRIGCIRADLSRPEEEYAADESSGNESAGFEHIPRMTHEGKRGGLE